MATLLTLAKSMEKLLGKLSTFGNKTVIDAASIILNDLTQVTPIDTATAVSNWAVSLDSPFLSGLVLAPPAPSPKGRMIKKVWTHTIDPSITAQANVPQTFQAGLAIIQQKRPGQIIFISNNTPYIRTLNTGTSMQAPGGFVERAIVLGEKTAAKARLL